MPLQSFIDVSQESDFPIQNLPYGIFKPHEGSPRAVVAISNLILELSLLEELGHFRDVAAAVSGGRNASRIFSGDSLNAFMALGRPSAKTPCEILQDLVSA